MHTAGAHPPGSGPCGDLTSLNTSRLILESVGPSLLSDLTKDLLDLVASSVAIYEKNGDYAFGISASGWCRFAVRASRRACGPVDDRQALASGRWLCHESCWNDASRASIEAGGPVDTPCRAGIRVYALPIRAGNEVVGAIDFGYGEPPSDPETLRALAERLDTGVDELRLESAEYWPLPPFIVELGRKRLQYAARIIGEIVGRTRTEEALRRTTETLGAVFQASPVAITVIDAASRLTMWNLAAERMFGWKEEEVLGKVLPVTPPGGKDEHLGFREKAIRARPSRRRKSGGCGRTARWSTWSFPRRPCGTRRARSAASWAS